MPPWLKERLYPQDGAHACQIFSRRPRGGRNKPISGCSAHLGSCPGSRAKGWELLLALPVLGLAGEAVMKRRGTWVTRGRTEPCCGENELVAVSLNHRAVANPAPSCCQGPAVLVLKA